MAAKKRIVKKRVIPFRRKNGPPAVSEPRTLAETPESPTAADPPKQSSLPLPKEPSSDGLAVFPHQLRRGDRYTDGSGQVWIVAGPPTGLRHGKVMVVRFRSTTTRAASGSRCGQRHERVRVERAT